MEKCKETTTERIVEVTESFFYKAARLMRLYTEREVCDGYVIKDGERIKTKNCPNCTATLDEEKRPKFCPECGQKIDWSKE